MKRITKKDFSELVSNCIDEKDKKIIVAYYYFVRYGDEVSRMRFKIELRAGFPGQVNLFYTNTIKRSSGLDRESSIVDIKNKLAYALRDSYKKINKTIPDNTKQHNY